MVHETDDIPLNAGSMIPADHCPHTRDILVHPALLRVFQTLDQAAVRWCLLRGEDELAGPPEEVDLLVDPRHRAGAHQALAGLGYVYLPSWGRGSHAFFLSYVADIDRWIKLDVVTEISFGRYQGLQTRAAQGCLEARRHVGPVALLDPGDAFWLVLLHGVLDHGVITGDERRRLQGLASAAPVTGALAQFVGGMCPPGWDATRMLAAASSGDWSAIGPVVGRLTAGLSFRQGLGVRARSVVNRLIRRVSRPLAHLRRQTITAAILAPDGAGKTTVLGLVASLWPLPTRSAYMGLYPTGRSSPTVPRVPGMGMIRRLARFWHRYLLGRYHQVRGRLVLFDRYPYDALLGAPLGGGFKRRARRRTVAALCPPPDVVVVLDAPGAVLHARKPERSAEELERQRREYRTFADAVRAQRRPAVVLLDADGDVDAVRRRLTNALWQAWSARLAPIGRPR